MGATRETSTDCEISANSRRKLELKHSAGMGSRDDMMCALGAPYYVGGKSAGIDGVLSPQKGTKIPTR